jgi:hypothetical protein
MRRAGLIAGLIALAALTPASPAAAQVKGHDVRGELVAGPDVAGSRIVWIERGSRGRLSVLAMPVAGGPVREEHWLDPLLRRAEKRTDYHLLLAGSAQRRAALVNWQDPDAPDVGPDADISYTFTRLVTAPAGGGANPLTGCTYGVSDEAGSAVAVSGNAVAWLSQCKSQSEISLLDFGRGRNPQARRIKASRGRYFQGLQLAGRYVLSLPTRVNNFPYPDAAELYDRRTGRLVHSFGDRRRHVQSASAGPQGRLAVTYSSVEQQEADCTPAVKAVVIEPTGRKRQLGGRPCFGDVQMVGDRVLLMRFARDYRGPLNGLYGESTLVTHDLLDVRTGDGRPVTRPFVTGLEHVSFTGDRLVYLIPRCTGRETIGSITTREALRRPLGAELCTGTVEAPQRRQPIGPDRRIRVEITCPRGCPSDQAALRVRDTAEGRYLDIEGNRDNPDRIWVRQVSAPAARRTTATVTLTEAAAQELRGRGPTPVAVELVVSRYDGSTQVTSAPVELVP